MAGETYRGAGVDVAACDAWLASLRRTLPAIGGFGGVFPLGPHIAGLERPCLVAGADGVGTKLLVARAAGDLTTVGIDCVAMVVNDLLCCGARPLFFLDYLAVGQFDAAEADAIVGGIRRACEEVDCVLLGGETAELPGLLRPGEFDVCGFGVGVVEASRVIDGTDVRPGDAVIGLPSSGLHANGFSLARRALPGYETDLPLARAMLTPTRLYVRPLLRLLESVRVKAIAHITGGGLPGNLCRVLPAHVDAHLDPTRWERPAIFDRIAEGGGVEPAEMFRTFNMGLGLCLVVDPRDEARALDGLAGEGARRVGEILPGRGRVQIKGVPL